MNTMETQASRVSLQPFLSQAATAGVVAGCHEGLEPEFEARKLALVALTTLHEGREAAEARLQSARLELAEYDRARAEEETAAAAAVEDSSAHVASPPTRRALWARIVGWFRRRLRGRTPESAVKPAPPDSPPVSRTFLAGKVFELDARCRELLGLEADYTCVLQAQFDSYRSRATACFRCAEGGPSCRI